MHRTVEPEVAAYAARCDQHLADLDPSVRARVRLDIEEIVSEVCAELDGTPDELVGPPARFVTELRSAAGLPAPPVDAVGDGGPTRPPWRDRLGGLWASRPMVWVRGLAPELRTAWWVLRGFLVAAIVGWITGGGPRPSWLLVMPYWRVLGSRVVGLGVLAGAVYLSVEAGRRELSRNQRVLRRVASVAAVVMAFAVVSDLRDAARVDFRAAPRFVALAKAGPRADGVVTIGSIATGAAREARTVEEAQAAVRDLLQLGPPSTIYIDADGRPTFPRTEAGIAETLQALADGGFLQPTGELPTTPPVPSAPPVPTNP